MPFQIAPLYDKMLKGMPLNITSYKMAIWKGIEGHLKGIVQKLEDSLLSLLTACLPGFQSGWFTPAEKQIGEPQPTRRPAKTFDLLN